jgi:uncharacterized membrane protein YccC
MAQATRVKRLIDQVRSNRRDSLRVGLQTAVAAASTYGVIHAVGLDEHLSWAVIASLFTISVSADSSVMQGLGRIAGAFLGVALGLATGMLGGPVVIGLALAAAAANMVASVWPNLRYAAVTAAIVALEPSPDAIDATIRAGAILLGTALGVLVTFVVWPRFGRQRVADTLRAALGDCETLLRLIVQGVETDEREERDATHARFLSRLERLHGQVGETYFSPRLPSGAPLRRAAIALENLWHALVILDRAISDERTVIGPDVLRDLRPAIRRVQEVSLSVIRDLGASIGSDDAPAPSTDLLCAAIAEARARADDCCGDAQRALGVHAVVFALDELDERLVQLVQVLRPGSEVAEQVRPGQSEGTQAAA